MDRLVLLRKQRAVGHGFFHEAVLTFPAGAFRWVYDCGGGRATETQVREYVRETGSEPIDLLFLSHLHTDHVSGLPTLLASKKVKRVFLPHLTSAERVLVFLRALADGSARAWFAGFIADPARWLRARGVEDVVEVQRGEQPPPDDEVPPDDRGDQSENVGVRVMIVDRGTEVLPGTKSVTDGARVFVEHQALRLTFLFYVKPAEMGAAETLVSKIGGSAGAALPAILTSKDGLKALREAYRAVWSDINWTSLCVACIPNVSNRSNNPVFLGTKSGSRPSFDGYLYRPDRHELGWLGLGDAVLKPTSEVDRLRAHLGQALGQVGMYSLPHHGSAENFCAALLDLGSGPSALRYATAKSDSKKHPAPFVRRAFEEHAFPLEIVSEDPETALTQVVVFGEP